MSAKKKNRESKLQTPNSKLQRNSKFQTPKSKKSNRRSKGLDSTDELQSEKWAIIALGSNLADPRANVQRAMERLQELSDEPISRSSLWETTPVDCPAGSARFVNAVVAFMPRDTETPESLLGKLQAMEKEFGRKPKKVLNEARPLDLDLIAFGNERRESGELTLPHPRAHDRRFVLQPLAEIAPGLVLPGQEKSVAELLETLPPDNSARKLEARTGNR